MTNLVVAAVVAVSVGVVPAATAAAAPFTEHDQLTGTLGDPGREFIRDVADAYTLVGTIETLKVLAVPAPVESVPSDGRAGTTPDVTAPADTPSRPPALGSGRCGGDLPDCSIMECESGGDLTAQNPTSSASGKWQFLDSSWDNFMGYPTAADAPEEVQDEKARQFWDGGAGAGHWAQCR